MFLTRRAADLIRNLQQKKESKNFIVRYNLRNPRLGRGHSTGGVRNEELIDIYIEGLERLYEVMTASPWSRQKPPVGDGKRTAVYVFNTTEVLSGGVGAWTDIDRQGVPYICLPCRSSELTLDGERHRAMAEAVHEATHVFNYHERPLRDLNTAPWLWMHEAMAIFMERFVIPDNTDVHRFLMNWVDMPEISLDAYNGKYQSGMFICYLAKVFGPEFVNDLWTKSYETEQPVDTIERLLRDSVSEWKGFSSHKDHKDVFASGYCMDSYFLWDPSSPLHENNLFVRYGERAISESFVLSANSRVTAADQLDHLACRYYRLYLDDITRLKVRIDVEAGDNSPLKAELAVVTRKLQRGRVCRLFPVESGEAADSVRLAAEISELKPDDIDHIVLVISNCGCRMTQENPLIEHDDAKQYLITASAC